MDLRQLLLVRDTSNNGKKWKIKVKIVQPKIMCSGRQPINFHSRGEMEQLYMTRQGPVFFVKFKSQGEWEFVEFINNTCTSEAWTDLKITNIKEVK